MSVQNVSTPGNMQNQYPVHKIYYGNGENVPPEKRGKEISQEDYKKLSEQRLCASKAPKTKDIKKVANVIEEWLKKYMEKPKKINPEKIKDDIQNTLDIAQYFNILPSDNHKQNQQNSSNTIATV